MIKENENTILKKFFLMIDYLNNIFKIILLLNLYIYILFINKFNFILVICNLIIIIKINNYSFYKNY